MMLQKGMMQRKRWRRLKGKGFVRRSRVLILLGALLLALAFVGQQRANAQEGSPLHPTFPLLDENGENVLDSGEAVSTMQTCGACHDAGFIVEHSFHADVGLNGFTAPGEVDGGRQWDTSSGLFGSWNPLTYRYLSPEGDARIDLTTAEWIQVMGARHVGGGPAVYSREGALLTELPIRAGDPQTSIVDPETGQTVAWDWQESGVVEMNCFLCHTPDPDNDARVAALQAGEFGWANTATLAKTQLVAREGERWQWNEAAFDAEGEVMPEALTVQDPTNDNCGQCHGLVHVDAQTPLVTDECSADRWSTITTGQIFSPQRLSNSGLNLDDKESLARSWDIHAERVVACTDCHYALNNPVYYQESDETKPQHLTFDPRRIDLGEYLYRPSHQFAKGQSAQSTLAPELDNTLRRCESCHSIEATHDWLPYKERHTTALSCESCHVPRMYAPARQTEDWTVLQDETTPAYACRGIEDPDAEVPLIDGFEPVLLPRDNGDGTLSLAPYNLIASWYWIYGDPPRPVSLRDLRAVWFDEVGAYDADVVAAFDGDGNGLIDDEELVIDTEAKESFIAGRLQALGLENPRIQGEVQPYSINHNVTHEEWATKECRECHSEDSRVTRPVLLSGNVPGGATPLLVADGSTRLRGDLTTTEDGALYYEPSTQAGEDSGLASLHLFGHDSVYWIDWAGIFLFLGTLTGATVHGGLRLFAARRNRPQEPQLQRVYMYGVYERLWHWLQTVVILGLIFTGLIIHKPDKFGIFSFRYVVEVHNILAALLVVNAALAAFYHLASGEIRQFLPRPHGFFDQAIVQARFYLRGIFKNEEYPFAKTPRQKLNPLQQMTYFGLLNVLLPLQVVTGVLMWGVQRWPEIALRAGGLPFLAPFHTLIAWLLASFVVMHVYLTTTGPTPAANIRAMIMGWDDVELHAQPQPTEG